MPGILTAKNIGWKMESGVEVNGLPMFLTEDRRTWRSRTFASTITIGLILKAPDDLVDIFMHSDSTTQVMVESKVMRLCAHYGTTNHIEEDTGDIVGCIVSRTLHRKSRENASSWTREVESAFQKLVADAPQVKEIFDNEVEKLRKTP
jgi:hypothetical protein